MSCECKTWGTDDLQADLLGNGHHHFCARYKPNVGAVDLLKQLVKGIEYWASQEDGVIEELLPAYRQAVLITRGQCIPVDAITWPIPREDGKEAPCP